MARRHLANAGLRSIALSPDAGLQAFYVRFVLNVVAAATVCPLPHFVLPWLIRTSTLSRR